MRAPARMCECIRARMLSCVNVCRAIVRARVHTRVFVRVCRGMRVLVCNERDRACEFVCVCARVGVTQ